MKRNENPITELNKDVEDDFAFLLRTENLSPAKILINLAEFTATGVSSGFVSKIGSELLGAIKTKVDERREMRELYYSLFGFCLNADFITSRVTKEEIEKRGIWAITDYYAAEEAVSLLSPGFSEKPKVDYNKEDCIDNDFKIDFRGNIVTIGGPCNNRFSRWIMKAKDVNDADKPDTKEFNLEYPDLHFIFDYDITEKSAKATWESRTSKELGSINYPIKKIHGDKMVYTPEIYYKYDNSEHKERRVCKKDYGMVVKMQSFNKIGRAQGRWYLMIAGCHGGGTLGAAKALGNLEILREIWNKANVRDFQAIIAADIEEDTIKLENGEIIRVDLPSKVRLLEIEPL